jgi:O-antigen/teichoic acid export membrane protein
MATGKGSMGSRVIKNIFSTWGMYSTITAIRFFLTPFFIHKLGDSQYGIWVLILSLIGYMELLNLGLNTANVRYLSKYFELSDHKSANEIFNSGLFIFLILCVGTSLLILSIAPFLGSLFSFMDNRIYMVIFVIAGLNLALEFVFYAFSAILSAEQKFFEVNIITTIIFIARSIAAVILLLNGYQLMAIVLNQTFFNVVRGLTLSVYSLRSAPNLRIHLGSVRKNALVKIMNFSFYIFIINICKKINLSIWSIVIAIFMSPNAITFFAISNNLIIYLQNFILAISKVLIPRFSQLDAKDNEQKIQEYYLSFFEYP